MITLSFLQSLGLKTLAAQMLGRIRKNVPHDGDDGNPDAALYDDKPVVKVIDFGVVKATGGTLTEHTIETGLGGVVGTPQYLWPDQGLIPGRVK